MAASTDMSDWIKFFTAAGIPPGPAAKYAVVFLDNRIQKSMLMDLTKEYLKEMGISIMGDVIAILKYAKTAHIKYENEKPAITALQASSDAKVEVKRHSTPGNRMLEHYMRKEGIMEGPNSKVTVSPSMAVRLGAVPVAAGGKKGSPQLGVVETAQVVPVKRPRMVKPEEEGKYVISMPKGSTPKTQKILQQQQQGQQPPQTPADDETSTSAADGKQSSVFARLGSGGSTPIVRSAVPKTKPSPSQSSGSSSIFSRLGGKRERLSSDGSDSSVVEYQGVLKSLSSDPATKTPKASAIRVAKPVGTKVTLGGPKMVSASPKESLQARLGKPTGTSTSAGLPPPMKSLQARLGAPVAKNTSVGFPAAGSKQKVTVTIGGMKSAGILPRGQPAAERLGVQTPEISTTTSTHMDLVGMKSKVRDRLGGGKETPSIVADGSKLQDKGPTPMKRSMQARLGAPPPKPMATPTATPSTPKPASTRQTVTVTLDGKLGSMQDRLGPATLEGAKVKGDSGERLATGATILKRIGTALTASVPTKQSRLQERLGVMRAEATSTTPSVTVTLGGGQVPKKLVSADGGKSQNNVFSRLGS